MGRINEIISRIRWCTKSSKESVNCFVSDISSTKRFTIDSCQSMLVYAYAVRGYVGTWVRGYASTYTVHARDNGNRGNRVGNRTEGFKYLHLSIKPLLQYGQLYCILPLSSGGCSIGFPILIRCVLQSVHQLAAQL